VSICCEFQVFGGVVLLVIFDSWSQLPLILLDFFFLGGGGVSYIYDSL
jgi:hypothetical protein